MNFPFKIWNKRDLKNLEKPLFLIKKKSYLILIFHHSKLFCGIENLR